MYKSYWVLLVLWATLLLVVILYLSSTKVTQFDPQQQLSNQSLQLEFEASVKQIFVKELAAVGPHVTILYSHSCPCYWLAKAHIADIKRLALEQGYDVLQLTLSTSRLSNIIPSTPAVIVFDRHNRLAYLGPLSVGVFCSSSTSLVESFIKQDFKTSDFGATILSDTAGCYCNT